MIDKNSSIHKLVSLTFDENPRVRIEAAAKLSDIDDPAAIFALMELSYDKDPGVKVFAQKVLEKRKSHEREVMDLAEIFSTPARPAEGVQETMEQKKEKILSPITHLFEKKLGKHKAEQVKNKMMPTIERVYMKTRPSDGGEDGKKAIQEFLTSYLEAISDIDSIAAQGIAPLPDDIRLPGSEATSDLEEVSKPKNISVVNREILEIEAQEKKEVKEEEAFETLPETVFKRAYESMLASGGDEHVMRRELKRTLRELEHEAKLAYHLAKRRFKETKITHISKIKDGMRNVNTDLLTVRSVENNEYKKGKEKLVYTRVLVKDESDNEGVVYLFDNRGIWLKPDMHLKIVKGYVKSFDFSGETAVTVSQKGNVYIVL